MTTQRRIGSIVAIIVVGDPGAFVMERRMLLDIKARADGRAGARP
jgi:hypothetical protein